MYIYKKKIVNFYNRFGINDTNDDDECVYMLKYCIYAFIYNEDNYTISNKKKEDFNEDSECARNIKYNRKYK